MKNLIRVFSVLSLVAGLQGVSAHADPGIGLSEAVAEKIVAEKNFYDASKLKLETAIPEAVKKQTGKEISDLKINLEAHSFYTLVSFNLELNHYEKCKIQLQDSRSTPIPKAEFGRATQFSLVGCELSARSPMLVGTSF